MFAAGLWVANGGLSSDEPVVLGVGGGGETEIVWCRRLLGNIGCTGRCLGRPDELLESKPVGFAWGHVANCLLAPSRISSILAGGLSTSGVLSPPTGIYVFWQCFAAHLSILTLLNYHSYLSFPTILHHCPSSLYLVKLSVKRTWLDVPRRHIFAESN